MDGMTVVLWATAQVNPGVNHIKLAIADAGDYVLDSDVFIKGESFVCAPPLIPTLTEWGLIILGVVLLGFITYVFLKRRKVIGVGV
jgi:LPXTG-motif cell wall-anchored protein